MICNDLFTVSSLVLTINYHLMAPVSPNLGIFSQFSLQTKPVCPELAAAAGTAGK